MCNNTAHLVLMCIAMRPNKEVIVRHDDMPSPGTDRQTDGSRHRLMLPLRRGHNMQNQSARVTVSSSTSSVDCESISVSVYGYGDDCKSTWRPVCLSVCLAHTASERLLLLLLLLLLSFSTQSTHADACGRRTARLRA